MTGEQAAGWLMHLAAQLRGRDRVDGKIYKAGPIKVIVPKSSTLRSRLHRLKYGSSIVGRELRWRLIERSCALNRRHPVPWCAYCLTELSEQAVQIDHVVPRCQDGTDDELNLAVSCADCNRRKGGRTPAQWAAHLESRGEELPFGLEAQLL